MQFHTFFAAICAPTRARTSVLVCAATIAFGSPLLGGLIINPIFDDSILSDPNAAAIKSTIQTAIQTYESSFLDDFTVNLEFREMNSGLGSSQTFYGTLSYSSYLAALTADATSADDATALASLPNTATNPVNGGGTIRVTSANLRALGFSYAVPPGGQADSIIRVNTAITNVERTNVDPSKYDLFAVVSHEIDEALGFGSTLNGLSNGDPAPTGSVGTLDLFRYDENGSRSFNTSSGSRAYFSIDGGITPLARFNQIDGGDFSDFFSSGPHTAQVQDAFATAGATPNPGVEIRALDIIGYNVAAPEPATGAMLGLMLATLTLRNVRSRG